jgi:cytidylate kinase
MKLILIYGAPGTGKFTVAEELVKTTGYTLFHSHLILNALSDIFGYDHPARRKLEKEFRLRIVEEAVAADVDLIVTGVIMRDNEAFYRQMISIVEDGGGKCFFVHLTASQTALQERVSANSRKAMNKISTTERLQEWVEQYPESFEEIDFDNQVTLDTSKLSPAEVSKEIRTFMVDM